MNPTKRVIDISVEFEKFLKLISTKISFQQLEAQIQSMKADQARVMEEERRKTLNEETKHARSVGLLRHYGPLYFSKLVLISLLFIRFLASLFFDNCMKPSIVTIVQWLRFTQNVCLKCAFEAYPLQKFITKNVVQEKINDAYYLLTIFIEFAWNLFTYLWQHSYLSYIILIVKFHLCKLFHRTIS